MTAVLWLCVLLAGGIGAVSRFTIDRRVITRTAGSYPWGTFTVNITGAMILGILSGLAPHPHLALIAGTGAIGSYTTFSTWMLETNRLGEERQIRLALINIAASITAGVAAAALGLLIGEHL